MKRPKLKDMTAVERQRWKLLAHRRGARRLLLELACINEPELLSAEEQQEIGTMRQWALTVIAVTKPSWVRAAPPEQLRSALGHIARVNRN